MSFYFEPQSRYLTTSGVSSQIGSQVLEWDSPRQQDLGLFTANKPLFQFNRFVETLDAGVWTKFNTEQDIDTTLPELGGVYLNETYPTYLLVRSKVALSGAALTSATAQAEAVVAAEVEKRLAEVAAWENASFESTTLSAYKNALANIGTDPNYPAVLAYEAEQGDFTNWPTKPVIDLASGPVSTGTNADVAFRQLVLSYSIPGSYPEKVTAMDNAVATYGENGAVEDLYNAAVAELNA